MWYTRGRLRRTDGSLQPVVEARRTETRIRPGGEALVVQLDAPVSSRRIGDDFARVVLRVQVSPHQFVLTNRLGARQVDRSVDRLRDGDLSQRRGNVVRNNGLHQ